MRRHRLPAVWLPQAKPAGAVGPFGAGDMYVLSPRRWAVILPDSEIGTVQRLIAGKRRFDMIIFRPLRFVQARLHLDPGGPSR
jgi:hypothetical protein